ncbi:TPA: porphobilinogen synthase [Candidatus Sumerlaeota bacterium]|jgi:porphobilinogen synthase|nr:porphobilinogen synthase [Candidatus Sumerlaeota bacterium]
MPAFPQLRMRRLRKTETLRRMVRENHLHVDDLIYPLFVVPGSGVKREISSMPGCYHFSVDTLVEECKAVRDLGIPAIMLFGIPERKDAAGTEAANPEGTVQRALRALSREVNTASDAPLELITDVCLCEYTDHGHCGPVINGEIANDAALELLARVALSHARVGATMVAPSDMMDGRVAAIRTHLDNNNFSNTPIMSYAAKYASAYYGPFREAADSAPQFGDRRSYQMDPANGDEALEEVRLDLEEGADIVMVKPGLAYMDMVRRVKDTFHRPTAVYNVSGEYAMVKAAAAQGWIDERRIVLETLTGFKRAGADLILTYHAKDAAQWLKD